MVSRRWTKYEASEEPCWVNEKRPEWSVALALEKRAHPVDQGGHFIEFHTYTDEDHRRLPSNQDSSILMEVSGGPNRPRVVGQQGWHLWCGECSILLGENGGSSVEIVVLLLSPRLTGDWGFVFVDDFCWILRATNV